MKRRTLMVGVGFACLSLVSSFTAAQVAWKDKTSVTVLKEYPEKPKDAPIELLGEDPKDREYEVVCLISATGGQTIMGSKKGSDLFKKMEADARKCGADAMIVQSSEDQTSKPLRGGIDKGARAQAKAIRFID